MAGRKDSVLEQIKQPSVHSLGKFGIMLCCENLQCTKHYCVFAPCLMPNLPSLDATYVSLTCSKSK